MSISGFMFTISGIICAIAFGFSLGFAQIPGPVAPTYPILELVILGGAMAISFICAIVATQSEVTNGRRRISGLLRIITHQENDLIDLRRGASRGSHSRSDVDEGLDSDALKRIGVIQ